MLKNFYTWFFDKYSVDKSHVAGCACDCHFSNFIISEDKQFHFIDREIASYKPVEKDYCILYALHLSGYFDENLYKYLVKEFNLPYKSNTSLPYNLVEEIPKSKNKELINEYFN